MYNYAEDIRRMVPAREMFEFYGFPVNRAGFVCCPLHGEKTPSLKVYHDGWKCYGCGAGSSVIDFVMQYFGLSFLEAEKKLNADFRLGLPIGEKLTAEQQREADRIAEERRRKQLERQAERERLETAYSVALDNWIILDKMRRDNFPRDPAEPFSEAYVCAVKWIDDASAVLDEAEDNLRAFEKSSCF